MIDLHDIEAACAEIWDAGDVMPANVDREALHEFLHKAYVANVEDSERTMGFCGLLAWGISIGIVAERNRRSREDG